MTITIAASVDSEIGRRIWRIRRDRMKRPEFAAKLGLSAGAIRKIELGEIKITVERLMEISRILGVPLFYFFEGFAEAGQVSTPLSPEAIGIARAIDLVTDPETRKKLLGFCAAVSAVMPAERAA